MLVRIKDVSSRVKNLVIPTSYLIFNRALLTVPQFCVRVKSMICYVRKYEDFCESLSVTGYERTP